MDRTLEEVDKDIFIPFVHRPLSHYLNAMAGAGLVLIQMEEPAPPEGFLARAGEYERSHAPPSRVRGRPGGSGPRRTLRS